jgi:hypothetical protein
VSGRPVVPVSTQAAGEVRRLRARLKADADGLVKAAVALPAMWVAAAALKGNAGSARAWQRILAAMPVVPTVFDVRRRVAVWRLLRPCSSMYLQNDGAGAAPGVAVTALIIGLCRGKPTVDEAPWSLSFSDHALARLRDRTVYKADLVETMLSAHDDLLGASRECAETVMDARDWALPGGPGAFLATVLAMRYRTDDAIVLIAAGTWISDSMLAPDQEAQVAALRFRQPGRALQDGLLLPAPLRAAARPVADDQGDMADFWL